MRRVDPVKHEEKRQAILVSAGRCFVRDGFRGSTISQICAEAKISPGHLYHYFASKEAIVGALFESGLEHIGSRFSEMLNSSNALDALVAEFDCAGSEHDPAKNVLILEMLAEACRNPAMAEVLRRHSKILCGFLAGFIFKAQARGQIDPGLDPDLAATVLISIIDGSQTLPVRDPGIDHGKSIEMLKIVISRFLNPPVRR
jgi:AcrR family transcriptional regulator